jgi:hypothetical protein
MKRALIVSLFLIALFSLNSFSQERKLEPEKKQVILKPFLLVGDIIFISQVLNNVEIRGNEVESFLTVRTQLNNTLQKIQDKNLQATDSLIVELNIVTAQNLLNLLDRATIQGAHAERYKRFVEAIIESSKAAQK